MPFTGSGVTPGLSFSAGVRSFIEEIHTGSGGAPGGTVTADYMIQVPKSHPSGLALPAGTIQVFRTGATTALTITLFKNNTADATINATSIIATANTTYETKSFGPSGTTYNPGDLLMLRITSQAPTGTDNRWSLLKWLCG